MLPGVDLPVKTESPIFKAERSFVNLTSLTVESKELPGRRVMIQCNVCNIGQTVF
jgi:hypothetical protein